MISKEDVFKYLSEGLLSEDPSKKWFNFKEDDADTSSINIDKNTNNVDIDDKKSDLDNKGVSLSWNFISKYVVLYDGPINNPNRKYEPFANTIRYYEFETDTEKKRKEDEKNQVKRAAEEEKNNSKKRTTLGKDFSKLAGAVAFGLAAVDTYDKVQEYLKQKEDMKNKYANKTQGLKDKNGRFDNNELKCMAEFHSMDEFKEHAIKYNRIPEKLVNEFIVTYQEQQELAKNGLETDLSGKNVRAKI